MKKQVEEVIESEIKPYLQMHGGSCELVGVDGGVVILRLTGGCSGCPASQLTLFNGIIPILKESVPEIKDIILG